MPEIPVSIRVNPFKECDLSHLGIAGAVPWCDAGLYLCQRPSFTLDPLMHAGAYYVQDASAMFVGYVLRQALKMGGIHNVLDLCAAPGGKSTDACTALRHACAGRFMLVSNEVIRQRAATLADNMAIWGDPNVVVTSSDPREFQRLGPLFDLIIADVPCSGEGMFRKSENARQMWSEDNVELCQARSRRIVADAWESLRPGGYMVFSTCTLNDRENDDNAQWICENLGAVPVDFEMSFEGPQKTKFGYLLVPGTVKGEGQYCALVQKNGGSAARPDAGMDADEDESALEFFSRDGEIYALPPYLSANMLSIGKKLNVLGAGVHAFTVKGKDRIPCADLALSLVLDRDDFPQVELSREEALKFLHKDALFLADAPTGYVTVNYGGLPLGFVKNLGSRANNLHPSSRRILMNINGK